MPTSKNNHLAWVWAPCAFKKHERSKRVHMFHVSTCEFARSDTPSTIQSPQVKSVDASVTSGFRTFENKQRAREVLSNVILAIGAQGLAIKKMSGAERQSSKNGFCNTLNVIVILIANCVLARTVGAHKF